MFFSCLAPRRTISPTQHARTHTHDMHTQTAISEERLAEAFDRIDADDSGYISAANLRELLGADFPKEEIDAIIKEADQTMDGKISYSEFLALWEDKNETRHQKHIDDIRELAETYQESDRSSLLCSSDDAATSDGVSDDDDDDGPEVLSARANFLEEKRLSERKATVDGAAVEGEPDQQQEQHKHNAHAGHKHVGFNDDVRTIPNVAYSEEEEEEDSPPPP